MTNDLGKLVAGDMEARQCDDCGFEGASHEANAEYDYCTSCGANAPANGPDRCADCGEIGHMVMACPECSGRFSLNPERLLHSPKCWGRTGSADEFAHCVFRPAQRESQPEPDGGGEGVSGTESLHKAIARLRAHVQALSDGKKAIKAGLPAPDPSPIAAVFRALPGIVRELEMAELEIESEFERYEDAALPPTPEGKTEGAEPSVESVRDLILKHAMCRDRHHVTPREAVTAAQSICNAFANRRGLG